MRIHLIGLIALIIIPTLIIADQGINLSDEAMAKEILLDKSWPCLNEGDAGKGTVVFTFKSIEGDKVKGQMITELVPACGWDVFNGNLKKDRITYNATASGPCGDAVGDLNFFHAEDGKVKAVGSWRSGGGAYSGAYTCDVM